MKTTIAFLAVLLCFGLTANAQDAKADTKTVKQQPYSAVDDGYRIAAINDVVTLAKYVELTSEQKNQLKEVFIQKHRMFAKSMTNDRKKALSQSLEVKLKSSLEPEQVKKLEGNKELLKTLTEDQS